MTIKQRQEKRKKYALLMEEQIKNTDTEEAHHNADKLLCNLLCEIGYKTVVDKYRIVDKWYA